MSSPVLVYSPQISIMLKKVISRSKSVAAGVAVSQRVMDIAGGQLELADFLGDEFPVTVRRSVRGEDSGSFSITFPDKMHPGQMESLYGLIEPMDVIEVRMARVALSGDGQIGTLPIILRGFVSEISRQETMTRDGPQRTVTVSGHDYSKILQIMRVIYLPTMIVGQDLLTPLNLFLNYSVDAKNYSIAADFVREVVTKTITPFIARMQQGAPGGQSPIMQLGIEASSSASASNVSPFGMQEWPGGTIFDLLSYFGDVGPWQELFVRDDEAGPVLVYRPTPFMTPAKTFIQAESNAAPPDMIKLSAKDVISLSASRSDADVANYFWVDTPQYQLIGSPTLQQDQSLVPAPAVTDYQNNDPSLYGIRLLQAPSQEGARYDGQGAAAMAQGDGDALNLNNEKRRILIENNKDNVVFERGSMVLKGNPDVKAGCYLQVLRGNLTPEYYAHTVTHQFIWGKSYTTQVEFDRGTGFIERVQRDTGVASPYLSELTAGGVYGGS